MDVERLRRLLDAYGADPERWPMPDRAGATALLARSAEARAARDAAARLDRVLALAPAVEPSDGLADRVLAAARPRRRNVAPRRILAAVVPLAAAAGLVLWLARTPPRGGNVLTPDAILQLGDYTAPSDVLLAPEGLDLADGVPSFGCVEGDLGCIDLAPVDERDSSVIRVQKRRLA